MPKQTLSRCCVKVSIKSSNGEILNQGTGVILKATSSYFILTAHHCIYGENDHTVSIPVENIWIEKQEDYASEFCRIPVKSIIESHKGNDWVLLEIEDPQLSINFLKILTGEHFIEDEVVHFKGYQSYNPNEPRMWEAKIIDIADYEFKITLKDKTFNQAGEQGAELAKGLSGSGIYIVRNDKAYLIGHIKSVITEMALNDDIKCCKYSNIKNSLRIACTDLGDIDELGLWEKASKKHLTTKDVETWAAENNSYFSNIERKNKVAYGAIDKANEVTRERILDFLQQDFQNDSIRSYGDLITRYDNCALAFEKTVKNDFTRTVNSNNEAKDLLIKLEKEFREYIQDLMADRNNGKIQELARHKVTWWLMNCSLDFKE